MSTHDPIVGARQAVDFASEISPLVLSAYLDGTIKEYDKLRAALNVARDQRDALDALVTVPTTMAASVPCGDGRCYCGGCVL